MITYIALLRGINVGGHNKVPMSKLCHLFIKAGFQDVKTYIQTGNVIFKTSLQSDKLNKNIEELIEAHFGFKVPVIVKTSHELQIIFNTCPFLEEQKMTSYFILLNEIPNKDLLKTLQELTYENEDVYNY